MFEGIAPLDPKAEQRKRLWIAGIIFTALFAAYLYYELRNYPEERQVRQFFEALEQEDFQHAYEIWQPTSSYTFQNFLEDWGSDGFEGPIRQFQIQDSEAGGTGSIVTVILNQGKTMSLWVEKKDKSLSFSPWEPQVNIFFRRLPPSLASLWVDRRRRRLVVPFFFGLMLAGYLYYESRKSKPFSQS